MPMVAIQGLVADHGLNVFQKSLDPRLWWVPTKGHFSATGGALAGVEQQATWLNLDVGSFEVSVYSEPNNPDISYKLRLDWLVPGQQNEPPENRARGSFEWPRPIFPDTGGNLGEVATLVPGVGTVFISSSVAAGMTPIPRYQLALNPVTWNVFKREISW